MGCVGDTGGIWMERLVCVCVCVVVIVVCLFVVVVVVVVVCVYGPVRCGRC